MIPTNVRKQLMSSLGLKDTEDLDFILDKCEDLLTDGKARSLPFYSIVESIKEKIAESTDYEEIGKDTKDFQQRWELLLKLIPEKNVDLPIKKVSRGDEKNAEVIKARGNEFYSKKKFKESVRLYTEAILRAAEENNRPLIGVTLGNRSAAFFQLKNYKLSHDDTRGAIFFDYPLESRHKLWLRAAKCRIHNLEDASKVREKLGESLKDFDSKTEKEVLKNLDDFCSNFNVSDERSTNDEKDYRDFPRNARVPQLAKYVDIIYNDKVGRHGIALKDISPGEPILFERPCVTHLNPIFSKEYCFECCITVEGHLKGVYPHLSDSESRFCSWRCFEQWSATSMKYEMNYSLNNLFKEEGVMSSKSSGDVNLAYEAVIRRSIEYFKEAKSQGKFCILDPKFGTAASRNSSEEYLYSDLKTVYDLEGHRGKRDTKQSLTLLIKSYVLVLCLRKSGYISNDKDETLLLGELIYHFLEGIQYNLHSIDKTKGDLAQIQAVGPLKFESIGSGIYPTLLLLNHSCECNTLRHNLNGDSVLVVAKRYIYKGEEVTDCYGPHHLSASTETRRKNLSRGYSFHCECLACQGDEEDFPLLQNLKSRRSGDETIWQKYIKAFSISSIEKAQQLSLEYIKSFYGKEERKVYLPDKNLEKGSMGLSICLWKRVGGNK